MEKYDVAIIGAGPGGLTAGIYALRSGLSVVVMEKDVIGGQASLSYEINNYPGFYSISGTDLSNKMHDQFTELGGVTMYGEISKINFAPMNNFIVVEDHELLANTVILSMGAHARTIGADGEAELIGRGICYSAINDGATYKGKNVAVVGSGYNAIEDAVYLSNLCNSVTVFNNLPEFVSSEDDLKVLNNQIENNKNIKVVYNSAVTAVLGKDKVAGVTYNIDGTTHTLDCDALFVAVGNTPDSDLVRSSIHLDENGYIATDENLQTNQAGVFACGDIRVKDLRLIVTSCADGAVAAINANKFINKNK